MAQVVQQVMQQVIKHNENIPVSQQSDMVSKDKKEDGLKGVNYWFYIY